MYSPAASVNLAEWFETAAGFSFEPVCDLANQIPGVLGSRGERKPYEMVMKRFSALTWYRVLRLHHHRSVLEAVRYAFWLAR